MFNNSNGYSLADIAAATGNGGNRNDGFGFGDGSGAWVLLIFILLLAGGGWNNGFGSGFGGNANGVAAYDFPWLMTGQQNINSNTNNGFRDAMINDNITSVRDGIAALSTQLCGSCGDMQISMANGFAGVNANVSNGTAAIQNSLCNGFNGVNQTVAGAQNAITTQLYTNQLADLERSFAAQTANTAGISNLQSQLAQCCCDNRAATADVKYTIATEACADRAAVNDALRDVIASNTANTQAILDKLCQQEIDNLKAQNQNLQMQNYLANLAASQNAQTGQILTDNAAQTTALLRALNPAPIPAYAVPNPYGCNCGNNWNNGYGCCNG